MEGERANKSKFYYFFINQCWGGLSMYFRKKFYFAASYLDMPVSKKDSRPSRQKTVQVFVNIFSFVRSTN